MLDMTALLRTQPVSGLSPQLMGIIDGFAHGIADWLPYEPSSIWLLEPPAGQREVFMDPVRTLSVLYRHLGQSAETASTRARADSQTLYAELPASDKTRFYDNMEPNSPLCVPASALLNFLNRTGAVPAALMSFMGTTINAIPASVRFTGLDDHGVPWTLNSLPALPPPTAMIEFVPAPAWEYQGDLEANTRQFNAWRNRMRTIAARLEQSLGEAVYRFAKPSIDTDDDNVHRFLLLHWLCSLLPQSDYVRFLVDASGAATVDALKRALIDPASYAHPFKMHDAFFGVNACTSRTDIPNPVA
ncbi:hypothetical protein FXN63_10085 [Pigmentiphaga aceris]|uniref:Uncharacterized protein n=1 Tax=Pigmentiphaga aceris TaxID=1940612 RepID=A0A5C0AWL2_9BURK|nr:hypothetical protein [Pigmentiphaga aceris]QEI06146.1 hypothetical protein FXN63_10085 [Pigmentiphaga aceris]